MCASAQQPRTPRTAPSREATHAATARQDLDPRSASRAGEVGRKLDPATVDPADRQRVEIHALKAAEIDRPAIKRLHALPQLLRRRIGGAPERQDAARRAEVILRCPRPPLIQRQLFPRCQQPKVLLRHPKVQRSAPRADRAIARSSMIDLRLDLEPHLPAVTRSAIHCHGSSFYQASAAVEDGDVAEAGERRRELAEGGRPAERRAWRAAARWLPADRGYDCREPEERAIPGEPRADRAALKDKVHGLEKLSPKDTTPAWCARRTRSPHFSFSRPS